MINDNVDKVVSCAARYGPTYEYVSGGPALDPTLSQLPGPEYGFGIPLEGVINASGL